MFLLLYVLLCCQISLFSGSCISCCNTYVSVSTHKHQHTFTQADLEPSILHGTSATTEAGWQALSVGSSRRASASSAAAVGVTGEQ